MTRAIRLRPWQRAALELFCASPDDDFLAVATPGAGKTTFALTAARWVLARQSCRLVVVAPTAHLKTQWATAAARFDLHLDPDWSPSHGQLPADMHGIVTTYQQVASAAGALRGLAQGSFVIFDEIHHAGDDRAWGTSVQVAFDGAIRRLSISGTPFRSDTAAIPFIRYRLDEAVPDYEYGYGDALRDGAVVRPVYFPRIDGHMEWSAPDGTLHSASFQDALDRQHGAERLRTALSLNGEWLPEVLTAAHQRLTLIREDNQPDAGGLVIATDQEHAREIAALLRNRLGTVADVVVSDDPSASHRIARFASGSAPWLVAVRMVSEGVDIPRLRVGVFATTTSTELFFRQAVGRFVRWTAGRRSQKAYFFIPDDARLRAHAFQIAEQRRHSLYKPAEVDTPVAVADSVLDEVATEQLSLFAAISSIATDTVVHAAGHQLTLGRFDDEPDPPEPIWRDDDGLSFELEPLPPLIGATSMLGESGDGRTRREHKLWLRDRNAELAKSLAVRTGWLHAKVNAEMNRLAGIAKVSEATIDQLERRLRYAESWLRRESLH